MIRGWYADDTTKLCESLVKIFWICWGMLTPVGILYRCL